MVVESPEKVCGNGIALVVLAFGWVLGIVIRDRKFVDKVGNETVQVEIE